MSVHPTRRKWLQASLSALAMTALAGCAGVEDATDDRQDDSEANADDNGEDLPESEFYGGGDDSTFVDVPFRDYYENEAEEIRENAEQIDYDNLLREIDDREGDFVTFSGEIIQVLEEGSGEFVFLIGLNSQDAIWGSWVGDRYIEQDNITVWAEVIGPETYEDVVAGQRTIPSVAIADIETS